MKTHRIAVIAGDGIGKEVIPAGIEILKLAAEQGGFACEFTQIPWGCDYYLKAGRMMDADGVDQLLEFDAIYLGAIGDPRVADHVSARELILPLRQKLGQGSPGRAADSRNLVGRSRSHGCRHRMICVARIPREYSAWGDACTRARRTVPNRPRLHP